MTDLLGELARAGDGTASVTFDRYHDTDPADLWDAVTDPTRLARWFAPVEGDLREGGTFVIRFDDADTPLCRVVACDAPRGFSWEWPQPTTRSIVEVQVAAEGSGSRLRVVHSRLTETSAPDYAAGWQAYLQALEAHLDGRDTGDWWERFAATRAAYAAARW
ncbi:SRPBCC family protein [Nakamurella sp. GG22]